MNPNPKNFTPEDVQKSETALREEATLQYWKDNQIFEKTLSDTLPNGKKRTDLVFYDGPPFATGLPHYGHILGGTGKDVFARYKTMRGFRVPRKWGWDTHGLPIETIVEKSLGITSKKQIEEMGLDVFAREARSKVLGFVSDWKKTVDRTARWVDFDGSYKTMDTNFIESVWWALGQMNEKGLVYEADRILPYCPRCQTPLANAEIAMDNSYKDIVDISVYVKMQIVGRENEYVLAWTTTPWTLPGNAALAVNPELIYVKVSFENGFYYVGKDRFEFVFKDKNASIVEELTGEKLVGLSYVPPFDYFKETYKENSAVWKVYGAEFVTADAGTGIVHIAPNFGEDDSNLAKQNNIPSIKHVGLDGAFISAVTHFAGVQVKPKEDSQAADVEVIKYLAHNHLLFAKEKITHSYPHCYRCETPLLYYGLSSWFIRIQDYKKRMLELNKEIDWVPDHLQNGRFKYVLENAPDWNFSRNRFWASPLPIWKSVSGKKKFISSISELKQLSKNSGNNYMLMRHGQAQSNIEGGFKYGVWDFANNPDNHLTELGKQQVVESAEALKGKKIDLIITSPIVRAQETAKITANTLGIDESAIITDERMLEWNVGPEFQWKDLELFFQARNAAENRYTFKSEGAESFQDVIVRVGRMMDDFETVYEGKNILIVGHGSSLRSIEMIVDGFTYSDLMKIPGSYNNFKNAEIREITFAPLPHNEFYELDLHRPYIDAVKLEIDGEEYTRVPEVIDCWFESGSMPFAQDHYPFDRPDWEQANFPADFVVEYIAQTRTWFYYMLLISTILFDKVPFKHVITTGNLNGTDGQKMSKSKGNYPDPWIVIDKYGVDALRMYLISSVLMKGEDSNFIEKTVDDIYKKTIMRLKNCLSFIDMYSVPLDTWKDSEHSSNVLDQWIMTRLAQVIADASEGFESYNTVEATKGFGAFVDDLSAWYLRRSRDRFKSDDISDRISAGKTLITILREFAKAIAPVMPFVSEEVWQKLRTDLDAESVHLELFPTNTTVSTEVLEYMDQVREIVTVGMSIRQEENLKVRQPLSELFYFITEGEKLPSEFEEIIKDELNIKKITWSENAPWSEDMKYGGSLKVRIATDLTEDLRNEGEMRDLVRQIQDMRKEADLMPSDRVVVHLETSEPTWFLNTELQKELLTTVGAEQIKWGSEGNKVEKQ